MCTLWIMASVQWVAWSSAAFCRTRLRTWMIMSQQSRRTMLENAGQKAGGTGGHRAENKYKHRESVSAGDCRILELCRGLCRAKTSATFITALLNLPLLLRLFCLQVKDKNEMRTIRQKLCQFNIKNKWWNILLPCCAEILNNDRRKGWTLPDALFLLHTIHVLKLLVF